MRNCLLSIATCLSTFCKEKSQKSIAVTYRFFMCTNYSKCIFNSWNEQGKRLTATFENIANGKVQTSTVDSVVIDNLDEIVNSDDDIISFLESKSESENEKIVSPQDRITKYKLAIKEAMKAPITGMGPFGYYFKYSGYPHNFILEIFSELGFIIGGAAILFITFCVLKLLFKCKKHYEMGLLLVLFAGYFVNLMVSGTVWNMPVLMFGIGYSLCYTSKE